MSSSLVTFGILLAVIASVSSSLVAQNWAIHLENLHRQFEPTIFGATRIQRSSSPHNFKQASATEYATIIVYPNLDCTGTPNIKESIAMGVCISTPESSAGTLSAEYSWDADADEVYVNFYSDASCTEYVSNQPFLGGIVPGSCFFGNIISISTTMPASPNADGRVVDLYTTSSGCSTLASSYLVIHAWVSDEYLAGDDLKVDDASPFEQDDTGICVYYALPYYSKYYSVNFTESTYYIQSLTTETTKSSCFATSETVQLESGDAIQISSVVIGDRVLVTDSEGNNAKYSTVIAVPHDAANNVAAVFTHLTTASGKDIKMTPEHLVLVSPSCDDGSGERILKQAGEVTLDMCLISIDRGLENVVAISTVHGRGVHTVVTADADTEMVVVNGLVASPFAHNHAVANAYYNIIRWLPTGVRNLNLIKQANSLFGSMVTEFSRS